MPQLSVRSAGSTTRGPIRSSGPGSLTTSHAGNTSGNLRWPDGFICPECGCGGGWRTGKGLWMCAGCGKKTSVTAGTIFHRSHTPLSAWFAAVWFVTSQKNGVSAQGLKDVLGFGSYETAWAWLHKLRRAMVRPDRELLGGVVELDQSFLGGRTTGRMGVPPTRRRSRSPSNATTAAVSAGFASNWPTNPAAATWWH